MKDDEPLLKIEINDPSLLAGNWSQLCATCKVGRNITTNEMSNSMRYSYLRGPRGRFRNPYDHGYNKDINLETRMTPNSRKQRCRISSTAYLPTNPKSLGIIKLFNHQYKKTLDRVMELLDLAQVDSSILIPSNVPLIIDYTF